jgi:predicted transcriptional regulator
MPYDSKLDKQLFTKSYDTENGKIVVSVYSYNDGPRKLQIIREVKNREGQSNFVKLGRLTKEELQGILPLIQEALTAM